MARSDLLTVGTLARQAGVSAQTLRHYDRLGILRPTTTTAAGYRLYSETDRARLELVRALRGLDFDLATIARVLRGTVTARAVSEAHLHVVDLQLKSLTRRRAVLRVLLRDGDSLTFERLQRLQVLSSIDEMDRARFVASALNARLRGTGHRRLGDAIKRAAEIDLPDPATDAQVEAWLELAEMVTDESFLARHRRRKTTSAAVQPMDMMKLCQPAAAAVRRGVAPGSPRARKIVAQWIGAMRRQQGLARGRDIRAQARELQLLLERTRDRREERFWELLGTLKPEIAESPISVAWPWLLRGMAAIAAERPSELIDRPSRRIGRYSARNARPRPPRTS